MRLGASDAATTLSVDFVSTVPAPAPGAGQPHLGC
jgi:3',5'-cyclic AMP phosphodiesterase CpdA